MHWGQMTDLRLLIAVDGGATATRARCADGSGRVLGAGEAAPSSLTLGVDRAWAHIRAAISAATQALDQPFRPDETAYGFALAGSRHKRNLASFMDQNPLDRPVTVMTDGYASLIGALDGRPGSVVAVGTGVTGHRLFADGTSLSVDGWGFPMGDWGSGAWIGLEAVHRHLRALDAGDRLNSPLAAALIARLGQSAEAIQDVLVGAPSTVFASLAPLVIEAADAGDRGAIGILDQAAAEVSRTVRTLDRDDPAPQVALTGGLAGTMAGRLPDDVQRRLVPAIGTALDGVIKVLVGAAPAERARPGGASP